jgi:hypothetical protein
VCAGRRRLAPVRSAAVLRERRLASGLADEKQHNSTAAIVTGRMAARRAHGAAADRCAVNQTTRERSSVDASRLESVIGLARAQWVPICVPPSARTLVNVERTSNSFPSFHRHPPISHHCHHEMVRITTGHILRPCWICRMCVRTRITTFGTLWRSVDYLLREVIFVYSSMVNTRLLCKLYRSLHHQR